VAAVVELDESNGSSETVTHAVANSNYGSVDAAALNATNNPIIPGENSFEKWQRWHVTGLGGSVSVRTLRYFATVPPTNITHFFNGHTTQGTYDGANHKQTVYAQPAVTATRTPEAVPTTAPATANIGIAGSLTGELTAAGSSDYCLSQIRTAGGAVAGGSITTTFRYEEVA